MFRGLLWALSWTMGGGLRRRVFPSSVKPRLRFGIAVGCAYMMNGVTMVQVACTCIGVVRPLARFTRDSFGRLLQPRWKTSSALEHLEATPVRCCTLCSTAACRIRLPQEVDPQASRHKVLA